MALAAGTILYVVFFEIVPRAKEVGATGIEQVAAMTAGFAVFLPTMLIREWKLLIYVILLLAKECAFFADEPH